MAKNKRGRHYKMTPRRKAALRKAQLASARSRRRRVGRATALVGATLAVGAGVYLGTRRSKNRPKAPGKELDLVRVKPVLGSKTNNWANVGRPVTKTVVTKTKRKSNKKYLTYVESEKLRLKKSKQREIKNWKARRKYWRSKPVGGR